MISTHEVNYAKPILNKIMACVDNNQPVTLSNNEMTAEEDTSVPLAEVMKRGKVHMISFPCPDTLHPYAPPRVPHVVIVPPAAPEGPADVIAIPVNKEWAGNEFHHVKDELVAMLHGGKLVSAAIASVAHPITTSNIGQGTYGVVHRGTLAINPQMNGKAPPVVAIKKFRMSHFTPDGDSDALTEEELEERVNGNVPVFHELSNLNEAVALAKMKHTNIIGFHKLVWDAVTDPEVPRLYMVMEYAPGSTLAAKLATNHKFLSDEPSQMLAAKQLASAVAYIHASGCMHRDINPQNILVGHNDVLKVADFGLCTLDSPDSGRARSLSVQNIMCRAPEIVLRYRNYTETIDIWSLGVVLYLIFMRKYLFSLTMHDTEHALLRMMIMHFGQPPVEWLHAIRPACLPGAIDIFGVTIRAATEELMQVHIMNQRLGMPPRTPTIITMGTPQRSNVVGFLFVQMMKWDHAGRPTAHMVSNYLNSMLR